jgi:hypothetical protein
MQRNPWLVRLISVWLCVSMACMSMAQTTVPSHPTPLALRISILDGEGALNNIRQRTAREPIVQVTDDNHKPVAGAAVLFLLPDSGPGGQFANGARSLTVLTDQTGRARASGLRPNGETGAFIIRVIATLADLRTEAMIRQVNVSAPERQAKSKAATHGAVPKWAIVAAAVAGGTVAGIAAAAKKGGGRPSTITITPGPGTVGPPH